MFDTYVIFKLLVPTCASMVMLKLFIYLITDSTLQIDSYAMGLKTQSTESKNSLTEDYFLLHGLALGICAFCINVVLKFSYFSKASFN